MKWLFAALVLLIPNNGAALFAEDEPEIIVELGKTQVYEGESIVYRITLNHVKDPSPPVLDGFADFDVRFLREESLDSTQIFEINGRRTTIERKGKAFYYKLTPKKTGLLRIPSPTAEVDGRTLSGRTFTLQVIAPDKQDAAILEIVVDRPYVYPMQPFTVTLKINICELPEPHGSESPLTVQREAPALNIPWVMNLPSGLVPATDWRDWLGRIETRGFMFERGTGFTINEISSTFPTQSATYKPPGRRHSMTVAEGEEKGYWEYTLKRSFTSQRTGELLFGPVTLKGTFGTGMNSRGRLSGEEIYAVAKPVTVTVKTAPEEGRPLDFTGAIGSFELDAALTPTRSRVGDPLTLTLKLKGRGTIDSVKPPDLKAVTEIADGFKIYDATTETRRNTRTFTYSLRPLHSKVDAFPSVPFSYFDVERERYAALKTVPIPLEISEADRLDAEEIISGALQPQGKNKSIESRKEGIFGSITELGAFKDESVRPELYAAALCGMAFFYFLVYGITSRIRRVAGDTALKRRKAAGGRAISRVRSGGDKIRNNDMRGGLELVRSALAGLVADTADMDEAGLTVREIIDIIESLGADKALADRVSRLLEDCDAALFGSLSGEDSFEAAKESEEVIRALLKLFKKEGRLR